MHLLLILAIVLIVAGYIGGPRMVGLAIVVLLLLAGGVAYMDHRQVIIDPLADRVIDPACVKRSLARANDPTDGWTILFAEIDCSRPRVKGDITVADPGCVARWRTPQNTWETPPALREAETHCQFLKAAAGRSTNSPQQWAAGD